MRKGKFGTMSDFEEKELDFEIDKANKHLETKLKLFDFTAEIKGETKAAYRLYDGSKTEWFPKSQIENNNDGTFTIPVWLAKEKGLI